MGKDNTFIDRLIFTVFLLNVKLNFIFLIIQDARVWIRDPGSVWKGAIVCKDFDGKTVVVEDEDNNNVTINIKERVETKIQRRFLTENRFVSISSASPLK